MTVQATKMNIEVRFPAGAWPVGRIAGICLVSDDLRSQIQLSSFVKRRYLGGRRLFISGQSACPHRCLPNRIDTPLAPPYHSLQ